MTATRLAWPKKNLNLWGLAKPGGVKIGPNTVDDKNSGRSSNDAKMHRKIVAQKETEPEPGGVRERYGHGAGGVCGPGLPVPDVRAAAERAVLRKAQLSYTNPPDDR